MKYKRKTALYGVEEEEVSPLWSIRGRQPCMEKKRKKSAFYGVEEEEDSPVWSRRGRRQPWCGGKQLNSPDKNSMIITAAVPTCTKWWLGLQSSESPTAPLELGIDRKLDVLLCLVFPQLFPYQQFRMKNQYQTHLDMAILFRENKVIMHVNNRFYSSLT